MHSHRPALNGSDFCRDVTARLSFQAAAILAFLSQDGDAPVRAETKATPQMSSSTPPDCRRTSYISAAADFYVFPLIEWDTPVFLHVHPVHVHRNTLKWNYTFGLGLISLFLFILLCVTRSKSRKCSPSRVP